MEACACTVPIECDGGHTGGQAAARTADGHSRGGGGGAGPRAEVLRASLPNPGPAEPDDPDGYYRRVCALFFFLFVSLTCTVLHIHQSHFFRLFIFLHTEICTRPEETVIPLRVV